MAGRLADEQARQRVRTDLDQNFVVEAGAGTGKTHLLVERIEALVASGRARLRNVVAITFTEKAAAELRVRVRERIERRLALGDDPHGRFRAAVSDLEIAPISTIHAFAADLLRERPVEAGVDPAFTVVEELPTSLFRTEAWGRWLESQKDAEDGPLPELIEYGIRLDHLRMLGDVLLRYRDVITEAWDAGPQPRDPVDWLEGMLTEIKACLGCVDTDCRNPDDRGAHDLAALERTLNLLARVSKAEARRRILGTLKLKIGGNQANWEPRVLRDIKDRLATLQAALESLREQHGHYAAAIAANWLQGYVKMFRELKAREGALDFDDLLLTTRNLLRDRPAVRAYFQDRFDAILVDEFQDTDPLQAEIVFFLAEDGAQAAGWTDVRVRPGKLFIVGDPKQSIYAFRRADIETYELAKEVLLRSGRAEWITANFRSVQPILTAVNRVFQDKMQPPPDGRYQPAYVALDPCPETRASDDAPALTLLLPGAGPDPEADVRALRRQEAERLGAFLRDAITGERWKVGPERRPARFGDITMLFRGMTDVPLYEDAFQRYGIPYRVTSSRTFYKREEVGWLLNVLHGVEHPTDTVAVWGALRSPFFGCSDREIYEFVVSCGGSLDYRQASDTGPASVREAYAVLRSLHDERFQLSVPRMVDMALARTHALETFLLLSQGDQRAANLSKVANLARALEESGILTFRAFVHWLRDMEEQAVDEAETPTVEEGDDVVRIMSIHAAKGLEFSIVVVPDLGRGQHGGADHLLIQRTTGRMALSVGRVGDWKIQTDDFETLKTHQDNRDAAERLRLLYVALTRAKDALVLPVFPQVPNHCMQADLAHILPPPAHVGTLHLDWELVDGSKVPRINDDAPAARLRVPQPPTPAGDAVAAERVGWATAREAAVHMAGIADPVQHPSGMVNHEAARELREAGAALETEPQGQKLGQLVHQVLAAVPLDRPDLIEDFVRYFGELGGLKETLRQRAVPLIRSAMAALVIRTGSSGSVWREVPFARMTGSGEVTEGAIDAIIQTATNITVLDFKTDSVATGQLEVLRAAYAPQLSAYVDVVTQTASTTASGDLVFLREPSRRP